MYRRDEASPELDLVGPQVMPHRRRPRVDQQEVGRRQPEVDWHRPEVDQQEIRRRQPEVRPQRRVIARFRCRISTEKPISTVKMSSSTRLVAYLEYVVNRSADWWICD